MVPYLNYKNNTLTQRNYLLYYNTREIIPYAIYIQFHIFFNDVQIEQFISFYDIIFFRSLKAASN